MPLLLGVAWVHLPNGWVFSAQGGGCEYPVFLATAAVMRFLLGDGAYALSLRRAPLAALRTADRLA
ncbi:MAG: hypothetical protein ACO3IW_03680 [Burkholderiales bacterium]